MRGRRGRDHQRVDRRVDQRLRRVRDARLQLGCERSRTLVIGVAQRERSDAIEPGEGARVERADPAHPENADVERIKAREGRGGGHQ